jgi:hypothetical protein
MVAAISLGMSMLLGCHANSPARVADTDQTQSRQEAPAEELREDARAAPRAEPRPRPAVRLPSRPIDSWVIYREAFKPLEDADIHSSWTGSNRLEIHTLNVLHITIDLRRLPAGAPRRGPWNLQIDKQGIEITGSRGPRLELVRGKTGGWAVQRD